MNYEIIAGDCLQTMRQLPAGSVQCVVTSPPYYGLRDYGTATWEGGDPECDHVQAHKQRQAASGSSRLGFPADGGPRRISDDNTYFVGAKKQQYRDLCGKCGARRIDNQIGLEETPEQYVAKLVEVFREVRRVLHPTGTCWINLGDSFQDKQLLGIPWRAAFALQADGWYLRSEIIWHKKAPMPESVQDRPTKAHEQVFLLSKSKSYFYDADAVREKALNSRPDHLARHLRGEVGTLQRKPKDYPGAVDRQSSIGFVGDNPQFRNRRSVWTLGPENSGVAGHFATMPTKLVEPCILAGSSSHGCCAKCGSPYERVVKVEGMTKRQAMNEHGMSDYGQVNGNALNYKGGHTLPERTKQTTGWQPTCNCDADVVPCTVLDCFSGASTVGVVALKHGRRYIGCELNPDYIALSHDRLGKVQPMLLEVTA